MAKSDKMLRSYIIACLLAENEIAESLPFGVKCNPEPPGCESVMLIILLP
jgi:hypothetical protein